MKTRILVIVTKGGQETFTIQRKGFEYTWYMYLIPVFGWLALLDNIFWKDIYGPYDRSNNIYKTLDGAKNAIDVYLKNIVKEKLDEANSKIVKVYTIKYP
jgi:hypothetical protein